MVRFETERPKMLAMFRANSQLEILKPAVTRFAYMFVVLERLVRVRTNLIRTINSDEWIAWDKSTTPKFLQFRLNVMNESWWVEAEGLVKTLNPIYKALRITDMEGSTMGLLYEYMDRTGESLNKNTYLSVEK
ncbi:hypothetical protein KP509_1Z107600 [Ceratopteris richardii]|nr:hypothetical protein KP509_1Z107600 [Ceratopteris richardii]